MNMKNKLKTTILGLFSALVLTINVNAVATLEEAVTFVQNVDNSQFDFTSQQAKDVSDFLFAQDVEFLKSELDGPTLHGFSTFNLRVLAESQRVWEVENVINNVTEQQTDWLLNSSVWSRIYIAIAVEKDLSLLPPKTVNVAAIVNNVNRFTKSFTFAEIFPYISASGISHTVYQREFKSYRNTLPRSQQIAITEAEVNALIATPSRSKQQDAWLTELTADLMALRLGQ
jgi:hypothetical protein